MRELNTSRPDIDEYFCHMVRVVSSRGTCARRKTGCILVNERNHVLATGYNGKKSGTIECFKSPCSGANAKSGERLDECMAIHAEANALLQCSDVHEIYTAYCTTAPCIHCVKLLSNTSCKKIIFLDNYPHSSVSAWEWTNNDGVPSDRIWYRMPEQRLNLEQSVEIVVDVSTLDNNSGST